MMIFVLFNQLTPSSYFPPFWKFENGISDHFLEKFQYSVLLKIYIWCFLFLKKKLFYSWTGLCLLSWPHHPLAFLSSSGTVLWANTIMLNPKRTKLHVYYDVCVGECMDVFVCYYYCKCVQGIDHMCVNCWVVKMLGMFEYLIIVVWCMQSNDLMLHFLFLKSLMGILAALKKKFFWSEYNNFLTLLDVEKVSRVYFQVFRMGYGSRKSKGYGCNCKLDIFDALLVGSLC